MKKFLLIVSSLAMVFAMIITTVYADTNTAGKSPPGQAQITLNQPGIVATLGTSEMNIAEVSNMPGTTTLSPQISMINIEQGWKETEPMAWTESPPTNFAIDVATMNSSAKTLSPIVKWLSSSNSNSFNSMLVFSSSLQPGSEISSILKKPIQGVAMMSINSAPAIYNYLQAMNCLAKNSTEGMSFCQLILPNSVIIVMNAQTLQAYAQMQISSLNLTV